MTDSGAAYAAGQQWSYRAPPDLAASRLVIGALVEFGGGVTIACCSVRGAQQRRPDGTMETVDVPFLPMTLEALAETVVAQDGTGEPTEDFAAHLAAWAEDDRGASYFTVPFEGSLERMIALQMAALVDQS